MDYILHKSTINYQTDVMDIFKETIEKSFEQDSPVGCYLVYLLDTELFIIPSDYAKTFELDYFHNYRGIQLISEFKHKTLVNKFEERFVQGSVYVKEHVFYKF